MGKKAKTFLVILGTIFIIVGLCITVSAMVDLSELRSKYNVSGDPFIQQAAKAALRSRRQECYMLIIIGVILLVAGIIIDLLACLKRNTYKNMYPNVNPNIYPNAYPNNYYPPINQSMKPSKRICTNCGKELRYNSMFCDMCGMKIDNTNVINNEINYAYDENA